VERTTLLYVGDESPADAAQSLFYLHRAFQDTRTFAVEVASVRPTDRMPDQLLARASMAIVSTNLPEEQVEAMRQLAQAGKSVLVVLNHISMAPTLQRLLGHEHLELGEATGNYSMLGFIDFVHPLFIPFADPRFSDFTRIHFWKHRTVNLDQVPHARLLARFDNGDPALAEIPAGKGRFWVLAAGWNIQDSQLALSSKFVPLLYAMLEQSGPGREERSQYAVGDPVSLPSALGSVTVRKPDASEVPSAGGDAFTGTEQPGIYTVTSAQARMAFAVNLAPEESRTAPLHLEELERLGVPIREVPTASPKELQRRKEHLQASQLENRQKLWRWLIVAALVVLVLETWLAGRVTRRPLVVSAETPS
jgi:hypothetical protein